MESNLEDKAGSQKGRWTSFDYGWTSTVRDLSSTILNGLRSCMLEEWKSPIWTRMVGYSGSSQADSSTKNKLARESGMFNLEKCPIFMELFPGQSLKPFIHNLFQLYTSRIGLGNH